MNHRFIRPAIACALLLGTSAFIWFSYAHREIPTITGPVVQSVRTNGMTLVWWERLPGPRTVTIRSPDGKEFSSTAKQQGDRFVIELDALNTASRYEYRLDSQPGEPDNPDHHYFASTAPDTNTPFSFMVFGDSGTGQDSQLHLARVMETWPVALILHTGDLVYESGSMEDYRDRFFKPYARLLSSTPFYPVLGNHDIRASEGKPFLETFSLPENGPEDMPPEHCYWFDHGNARFVGIDSNLDRETLSLKVAPWLGSVMADAGGRWKFVFMHHSPWAAGSRPADMDVRETLVPVFEKSGIDIVFSGHNHLYQRTYPILHGKSVSDNGVVYITSGAGGGHLTEEKFHDENLLAAFNNQVRSFTLISMWHDRIELKEISEDNMLIDTATWTHDAGHG